MRTDDPGDLVWLEQTLLPSEPKFYKRIPSSGMPHSTTCPLYMYWHCTSQGISLNCIHLQESLQETLPLEELCLCSAGKGFARHYRQLASDRYYIKLDDDIMYIKEGAIEAMLREKLRNRFWIISANVINHSGM